MHLFYFYKSLKKPPEEKVCEKTTNSNCPSPAVLVDYIKGKKKGNEKKKMHDHIAGCKDCQYDLKSMFDLSVEEDLKKQ